MLGPRRKRTVKPYVLPTQLSRRMLTVMRAPTFSFLPVKAGVTLKLPAVKHILRTFCARFSPVGKTVLCSGTGTHARGIHEHSCASRHTGDDKGPNDRVTGGVRERPLHRRGDRAQHDRRSRCRTDLIRRRARSKEVAIAGVLGADVMRGWGP